MSDRGQSVYTLAGAEERRKLGLEDTMGRKKAKQSIFPINQLPREILAQIFWHCVPENRDLPRLMSSNSAPLLLCRVCPSWRQLALATPNIWTTVGIIIRTQDADPSAFSHVINIWLERSGILPLTLYLVQHLGAGTRLDAYAHLKAILSVLYSHSSRWENVTFNWFESPELSLPRLGKLPFLRAFHLFVPSRISICPLFSETPPRLAQLSWPHTHHASMNPQIPWSQITYLHIVDLMTVSSASEMIRLCPQMEEFSVHLEQDHEFMAMVADSHVPRGSRVVNYHLQKLSISVEGDCSSLLDSLALPALREFLSFFYEDLDYAALPFTCHSLLAFLTQSKCKLKELRFYDCRFIDSAFLECLAHESLETIEVLDIAYNPKFTDPVLIGLTDLPSLPAHRVLLPKLTHLTLKMCLASASPGTLGGMLLSRYCSREHEAPVERLESLSLMVRDGYLSEADKDIIEDAAAEGVKVELL